MDLMHYTMHLHAMIYFMLLLHWTRKTPMLTVDRCEHVFVRISTFICTSRPNGSLLSELRGEKGSELQPTKQGNHMHTPPLVSTRPHKSKSKEIANNSRGYICTSQPKSATAGTLPT